LCLGPIAALVSVITRASTPVAVLALGPEPGNGEVRVVAKVLSVSPTSGTASVRIAVQPALTMIDDSGLTETLLLRVNDSEGTNVVRFGQGQPVRPIDVVVLLEGPSIERYPFDEYAFTLIFKVERVIDPGTVPEGSESAIGSDAELETIPMTVDLTAETNDFSVSVADSTDSLEDPVEGVGVDFAAQRPLTTVLWAVGVMLLMWGLAIVGVFIAWAFVMWGIEYPMWAVGYYLGVLFAMPPLRQSLPGTPPPGTLLDFVAFYWAVGIIVVTLMTLTGTWLQRARAERPALVLPVVDPELDDALAKAASRPEGERPVVVAAAPSSETAPPAPSAETADDELTQR
ncbi:MAG: DUF4436 family protein, partial [Actinobacteria bacterium]|nr:DUF4436 family protein [Actinomycetota bacterium]